MIIFKESFGHIFIHFEEKNEPRYKILLTINIVCKIVFTVN